MTEAEAKAEAIQRALDAADAEWKIAAKLALAQVAVSHDEFSSDDLWSRLAKPREPRALGGVIQAGVRAGWMKDTGRTIKAGSHLRPLTVWASLVRR